VKDRCGLKKGRLEEQFLAPLDSHLSKYLLRMQP
jgi:hypothetical protein